MGAKVKLSKPQRARLRELVAETSDGSIIPITGSLNPTDRALVRAGAIEVLPPMWDGGPRYLSPTTAGKAAAAVKPRERKGEAVVTPHRRLRRFVRRP
jgi:hypothetical protein